VNERGAVAQSELRLHIAGKLEDNFLDFAFINRRNNHGNLRKPQMNWGYRFPAGLKNWSKTRAILFEKSTNLAGHKYSLFSNAL
jgi:hypothetical protein